MKLWIGMIMALAMLASCADEATNAQAPAVNSTATVMQLKRQPVPRLYVTSGNVTSDHRVAISSRLSGYIRELLVREGDRVQAGQVLVRVDPVDARQALLQAKADLADAEADLRRYEDLLKAGAVTPQQADKVRLRYKVAKSQVEQAKNQLGYAEVSSPVAGVVVAKHLSQGDLAAPGAPILIIEDPASLLVETHVSEARVSQIHEGSDVLLTIPAIHRRVHGKVRQVVAAADPVSHQFLVKIALPADADIHPGMYAETAFILGSRPSLLIPREAIVWRAGLAGVYLLDGDRVAHYRQIRVGPEFDGRVEVLAGLEEGDVIAWNGEPALRTGYRVSARADAR